ncbi:MAG: nucleotidyltransferase [Saprospiraceae bacterium]
MLVLENKATQVDSLLDKMAEDIQLDKTRYERMIQSYEAVKKWIEADEAFFKPYKYEVYPHGSVRIFTSVKPIGKDEFDLDIVLHFVNSLILHSPLRIYTELKRRLSEHETYRKMLEPKSRCLRLNYSGDFHMDIMPGIQESLLDVNKINVPDRELGKWVSSNPRGFAEWFMGKANLAKSSLLERAVKVEKIQADDFNKKKPLQRAVQLIKRYRDIYFENDSRYKTRSIVLTTIAGEFYMGEESIFDTIDQIITRIRSKIYYPQRLKIYNPINPEEDFTDKWDTEPKYYEAFIDFVEHLYREWQKLKKESGVIEEGKIFKGLFGAELFERAQMQETNLIGSYRKTNDLGIIRDTGIISKSVNSNTEQIKKNTFFGNEDI